MKRSRTTTSGGPWIFQPEHEVEFLELVCWKDGDVSHKHSAFFLSTSRVDQATNVSKPKTLLDLRSFVADQNECHCCRRDDPRRLRTSKWARRVLVMVVFLEVTRDSLVQGTPINRNGNEGQGGAPRSSFRRVIEG